jgi:hypothetical protein
MEQTTGSLYATVKVEIYGALGGKVLTGELTGEKKHVFSIDEFQVGIYFVRVVAGNEAETFKLIKIN